MSKNKNDFVANTIYSRHIHGDGRRFLANPVTTRVQALQRYYIRRLTEMCIARFEWKGLPESIDRLFLEKTLHFNALSVFYHDPRYGEFMALRATQAGHINVTDNPTRFQVYGNNFPSVGLRAANCVPIWGNITRAPDNDLVLIYAQKFADLDTSLEINARNARRSKVVQATEGQRLTMTNVVRQLDEGAPAIFVEDGFDTSKLEAIDLGINPDHLEVLHIYKTRLWNECCMLLGIDGANQDKKERLVSNEVEANAEQINLSKVVALSTRKEAAEQINRKYGLNVSVDYHTDVTGVGFNAVMGNE